MESLSSTQQHLGLPRLGCAGSHPANLRALSFALYGDQKADILARMVEKQAEVKLFRQQQSKALDNLYFSRSSKVDDETASIENQCLSDFQREAKQGKYPIYELALQQDRSYVEDPAFCLKFLRANKYDVQISVKQMIDFLRQKAIYFGADTVARDITVEDLSTEELQILLSGQYYIQETDATAADPNGRVALYCFNTKFGQYTAESQIRVNYYIWYNILTSMPAVQTKGVVAIYYDLMNKAAGDIPATLGLSSMRTVVDFMSCIPIKCAATHLCLKPGDEGTLALQNLFLGLPLKAKEGAHLHYGSDLELQGRLQEVFGIPQDTSPIDRHDGTIREAVRNAWLHNHLLSETDNTNGSAAAPPPPPKREEIRYNHKIPIPNNNYNRNKIIKAAAAMKQGMKKATFTGIAYRVSPSSPDDDSSSGGNTNATSSPPIAKALAKQRRQLLFGGVAPPPCCFPETRTKQSPVRKRSPAHNNKAATIMAQMIPKAKRQRTTGNLSSVVVSHKKMTISSSSAKTTTSTTNDVVVSFKDDDDTAAANEQEGTESSSLQDAAIRKAILIVNRPSADIAAALGLPPRSLSSSKKEQQQVLPHSQFPSKLDVLFGKGKGIQNHIGNVMFRQFVENFQEEYNQTNRIHRRQVSANLTQILLKVKGVRFWRQVCSSENNNNKNKTTAGTTWEEVNLEVAELKVGQLLRTFRKKQEQQQTSDEKKQDKQPATAGKQAMLKQQNESKSNPETTKNDFFVF
mmetsp:Transcript_43632/g.105231  ORF Transcript_43632/g.105231 Transcript_43632/m.105231 type:complete len:746 (+) Transcript_43632:68-2305(+)